MSLEQIAPTLEVIQRRGDAHFTAVATDTRGMNGAELFVALTGENFDGNDFVAEAQRRGAAAALISRDLETTLPFIRVADTQTALGRLGAFNRQRFEGPVIGITGSVGKTACKEMVAAILGECGPVLATQGNLNNEIGAPLTLLAINDEHRFAVVEMGAGKPGDIDWLGAFVQPDIALVNNVRPAHLERLGSLEEIAHTKGAIYANLKPDGTGILNLDEPWLALWESQLDGRRRMTFSLEHHADFCLDGLSQRDESQHFTLHTPAGAVAVDLPLPGRHALANALAAAAASFVAGAGPDDIAAGLARVRGLKGRLRKLPGRGGRSIIDDSYNANPGSVEAAIDVLSGCAAPRALILGDMAELGDQAPQFHRHVGEQARAAGIERLLCAGRWAQHTVAGFGSDARAYATRDELIAALDSDLADSIAVLVKGSRSAGMEAVVAALAEEGR